MIDLKPESVQDLIGKPYARAARGPEAFDCWGLCVEVYRRAGIALPDFVVDNLTHEQTRALVLGTAPEHAEWIDKPEPWCFVFDRRHGHMGLFCGGYVLHCARGVGTVMQRIDQFAMIHPSMTFARWRA